jgi:hypothetical protein
MYILVWVDVYGTNCVLECGGVWLCVVGCVGLVLCVWGRVGRLVRRKDVRMEVGNEDVYL